MKSRTHQPSCYIIGKDSLSLQCANLLLQYRYRILGIISADSALCLWAEKRQLPVYDPSNDSQVALATNLATFMQRQPCDYLFSIHNKYILPKEILTLPDQYAINYHDAPLPKYAGMYATSWAILNREDKYGISWHVMTEEVDAGDILKQSLFDIAPHDTALTLNARCYETAIATFEELIDELAHHQIIPTPQNLAERTYFLSTQRPYAGGVISWQQNAEEIDALCRALTFGVYPNDLTLPKVALGDNPLELDLFIVDELTLGSPIVESGTPPGTILAIDNNEAIGMALTVATRSGAVVIKKLQTIDGIECFLDDLVEQYDLQIGKQLCDLAPTIADAITARNRKIARHEPFWHDRLATLQPIEPPYQKRSNTVSSPSSSPTDRVTTLAISMPEPVIDFLQARAWATDHFIFTLFAVYLSTTVHQVKAR